MGLLKKIAASFTILTLVIVLIGVKIYFDVMDDKEDFQKLIQQSPTSEEEYNEKIQICEKKEYFDPLCQLSTLNYRISNDEEIYNLDCEKIQYKGVPYYLIPFENKIKEYFEEIQNSCKSGTEKIIELK